MEITEDELAELQRLRKENKLLKESLQEFKNQQIIFESQKKNMTLKQNQLEYEISSLKDIICRTKKKLMASEEQYNRILQRNLELETKIDILEEEISLLRENLQDHGEKYPLNKSLSGWEMKETPTPYRTANILERSFQISPFQERPQNSFEEIYLIWFSTSEALLKSLDLFQKEGLYFFYQIIELLDSPDRIIFPFINDMKYGLLVFNLFGKSILQFSTCLDRIFSFSEYLNDNLLSNQKLETLTQVREKIIDNYGQIKITGPCNFPDPIPKSVKSTNLDDKNKYSLAFGIYFVMATRSLKLGITSDCIVKKVEEKLQSNSAVYPKNACSNMEFMLKELKSMKDNLMIEEGNYVMTSIQKNQCLDNILNKSFKKVVKYNLQEINLAIVNAAEEHMN